MVYLCGSAALQIRLSVGLEDTQDILEDLQQALEVSSVAESAVD